MATKFFFDNKAISIPGAYSTIKSGIKNPSVALAFGNCLVIDTGSGKFYGGGSGINGTLKEGKDAQYAFDNVRDFRTFQRGGLWWLLGAPMFAPGGGASAGISSLTFIKAATTIPAELAFDFGSGDVQTSDDGSVVVQVNAEGYVGNGVLGDETRAKATITVTNAGSTGNEIAITIDGEDAGSYATQAGNNIAAVVAGLAAAIDANGLAEVFSTSSTQIVIYAPHGAGADLNGSSPVINQTGTAAASTSTFAGGAEGTILTRGYAAKMSAGVNDSDKHIFSFYRGTFKGLDGIVCDDNNPYDEINELACKTELLCSSPEVDTVTDLVAWMNSDYNFKLFFTLESSSIATTDAITLADRVAYSTYLKAAGGTESYSDSDLADAIDSIADLTFDFILADKWGDDAVDTSNETIIDWVTNEAPIKPDVYIGGGKTVSEWSGSSTSSNSLAIAFDSQYVTLVHGGAKKIAVGGLSMKEYDSIYKAANLLGREAGLAPQIPLTFKNIGINGELHLLNKKDVELGLDNGVLMTRLDGNSFEVVKGVNTLQNNSFLVNPDGSTASKQFARIERQLNKELVFNAKRNLLKKPTGANRNTVSAEDVKSFTEGYLQSKVSNDQKDDLLISFQRVTVVRNQDAYEVTYEFEPNTEISFLFFTGIAIDPSQV